MGQIAPSPIETDAEVSPWLQRLCRALLRLIGWRVETWDVPLALSKVIVIGEHHTSNMDSFLMILIVAAMGRRLSWLVKSELDLPVIGAMIRATGGIFVDRHAPNGTVGQVVERIQNSERIFLVLAPSGTRSRSDRWRSGFYYMALQADVPIALGYLDYARKAGGVGNIIAPSGDIKADEPIFQRFFAGVTPRYPEKASTVRLEPPDASAKS